VSILEVDLTTVLNEAPKPVQARDVNRFPSSDIDLAFVLPDDIAATLLQRAIRQAAGKKLVGLELFDVYRGVGVAPGHRSLGFRLRLQEPGGTMTEADIAEVQRGCIAAAEKIGAQLRS
jgi:phenylalanyl-tRNA synthetase beta chain